VGRVADLVYQRKKLVDSEVKRQKTSHEMLSREKATQTMKPLRPLTGCLTLATSTRCTVDGAAGFTPGRHGVRETQLAKLAHP
jgi:hypothetical protein